MVCFSGMIPGRKSLAAYQERVGTSDAVGLADGQTLFHILYSFPFARHSRYDMPVNLLYLHFLWLLSEISIGRFIPTPSLYKKILFLFRNRISPHRLSWRGSSQGVSVLLPTKSLELLYYTLWIRVCSNHLSYIGILYRDSRCEEVGVRKVKQETR